MFLLEDEKGCIELENLGPEQYLGIDVSSLPSSVALAQAHQLGHAQDVAIDGYDDPNFDPTAPLCEDDSPYPEVRSAVANTDDPTMLASTFRAWVLGLAWAVIIPGANQFFYFRNPSVTITPVSLFWRANRFSVPRTELYPSNRSSRNS
jgi:OPT oligopeptide transporter protein